MNGEHSFVAGQVPVDLTHAAGFTMTIAVEKLEAIGKAAGSMILMELPAMRRAGCWERW